jgi:prepilin signal peptidase PulO-like enzyme (type II secretory pathway)
MNIISVGLLGLSGLIIGPIINALADNLPTIKLKRLCSNCKSPRLPLALAELAIGHRACPQCRHVYGLRAPIVELITATGCAVIGRVYGLSVRSVFALFCLSILILSTVTDLERRLIYNKVLIPALCVSLLAGFVSPWTTWQRTLLGGAINLAFFCLAALLARGGIGGGDVKLATFIGLSIGFPSSIAALVIGVFLGGLVGGILYLLRRVNRKTFLPYGPFLAVGGAVVLIWAQIL